MAVEGHDDYDDDSDVLGVDELRQLGGSQPDAGAGDAADAVAREMLESHVDCVDWRLEVERVLPQLKLTSQTESKVSSHLFTLQNHSRPTPSPCPTEL